MMRYAYLGYAAVLDRAIAESRAFAPEMRLAAPTLLAVVQAPAKAVARRIADARERRLVERIYDELQASGTVERHLPEAERVVRDLHAREVLARRAPAPHAAEVFPFRPRERVVTRVDRQREARRQAEALSSAEIIPLRPAGPLTPAAASVPAAAAAAYASSVTREPMLFVVPTAPRPVAVQAPPAAIPPAPRPEAAPAAEAQSTGALQAVPGKRHAGKENRDTHVTLDDDIGEALGIAAKTAKRLSAQGIRTVRDLLKAEPAALAVQLNVRSLTAQAIGDWQDQALLLCAVPGLKPAHAQLLVGAGYRTGESIAEAEADKLCGDVLAYAETPAGQRVLRSGEVPDIERIKGWLEAAQAMRAA